MRTLLFILLFALPACAIFAQYATLRGQVMDRDTKEFLLGAKLELLGDSTLYAVSYSDKAVFVFNAPPGIYRLRASRLNYTDVERTDIVLKANKTTHIRMNLSSTLQYSYSASELRALRRYYRRKPGKHAAENWRGSHDLSLDKRTRRSEKMVKTQ